VLNRALELVYGLQTGMTSNAWVLHHTFGHHLHYLDQTLDESRWKRRDGSTMGPIAYSLEVMFTSYLRAFRVGLERRAQLPVFIGMLLVTMFVIGVALWFRPLSGLFVFVLAPAASLFITAYATYKHHSGLDTTDPYAASRNIVDPIFNLFTGNLGFHTAHHLKPGVHWSRLPALHRELAPRIPEACYLPAEFPFNLWPQRESQRTR
jgi:fatty acid desaturase